MTRRSNLRWYIAGLLFTATIINYIDRQALSVLAPVITKELNLSAIEYSTILQFFLIAYTLMYLGSGLLVDRWGTRVALAVFMVWWSIANALHAFVRGGVSLGVFRFLLGVGEPGNFMAAFKATSEWFPAKERAFVNGLVNAGAAIGAVIATPLVSFLSLRYGWRAAFVVTGALGLVWLVAWLFLYYTPQRHPRITPAEFALVTSEIGAEGPVPKMPWGRLLRYRQSWGLMLARFVSDPVWWFYLFWLPKYLADRHGFTLREIGLLAWVPYLAADFGSIGGGLLSGYFIKRGWPVMRSRVFGMWPFACLMPLSMLIPVAPSSTIALAIICVVAFAHMAWRTNLATVTNDLYDKRIVGSAAGLFAFGTGLGGTLFTNLTGYIVQNFSYDVIFVLMAFLHPLGFLVFQILVNRDAPEQKLGADFTKPAQAATWN